MRCLTHELSILFDNRCNQVVRGLSIGTLVPFSCRLAIPFLLRLDLEVHLPPRQPHQLFCVSVHCFHNKDVRLGGYEPPVSSYCGGFNIWRRPFWEHDLAPNIFGEDCLMFSSDVFICTIPYALSIDKHSYFFICMIISNLHSLDNFQSSSILNI